MVNIIYGGLELSEKWWPNGFLLVTLLLETSQHHKFGIG